MKSETIILQQQIQRLKLRLNRVIDELNDLNKQLDWINRNLPEGTLPWDNPGTKPYLISVPMNLPAQQQEHLSSTLDLLQNYLDSVKSGDHPYNRLLFADLWSITRR